MFVKSVAFLALVACAYAISDKSRLTGGAVASAGQFPHVASVKHNNEFICSGTLIFERWVLTSAECIVKYIPSPSKLRVQLGGISIVSSEEPGRVELKVDAVYHHFSYVKGDLYNANLGLIRLAKKAPLGENIGTAKFQDFNSTVAGGKDVYLNGWGGTTNSDTSSNLLYTVVKTISTEECSLKVDKNLSIAHACTSASPSASPCWYDHGSALVEYIAGVPTILGVTAVPGCTDANHPTVYMNPSYSEHMNWIDTITSY